MKSAVVHTSLVYFFSLLLVCLLNIDNVLSWYENGGEGREDVLRWLAAAKRIRMETGIGPSLDRFECAAGFMFEGSYKDKSKCDGGSRHSAHNPGGGGTPHVRSVLPAPVRAGVGGASRRETGDQVENGLLWANEPPEKSESQLIVKSALTGGSTRLEGNRKAPSEGLLAEKNSEINDPASSKRPRAEGSYDSRPVHAAANEPAAPGERLASVKDLTDSPSVGEPALVEKTIGNASVRSGPRSLLLVGDSLAYGLAISLGKDIKQRDGTELSCFSKVSSGLLNPNVFNWEKNIGTLIDEAQPQSVLIMMGANDANNHIRDGGKLCMVETPEWADAYEKRVLNFLNLVSESNTRVFWIGVPVVREEWLQKRIALANMAAKNACGRMDNCRFVDTHGALCDERGHYTNYLKEPNGTIVKIRAKDGIHFTVAGSKFLSRTVLPKLVGVGDGSLRAEK